jgi:TIR domain
MGYVFISFRRQDTHDMAWRLVDYLEQRRRRVHYLEQQGQSLSWDMDMFAAGDFRVSIRTAVESADVVMVLVGKRWLDDASSDGFRSPGKWVEREIELAFAKGIPVLPVLVHGSSMPRAECPPKTIRDFAYQQAASVRSDAHFADDAKRVCTMRHQLAPSGSSTGKTASPRRRPSAWWNRLATRLFRRL